MILAFVSSLVGFGLGVGTLPLVFPGSGWFGPTWAIILLFGIFPYVPTVFVPVLAAHSAMFLIATTTLQDRLAKALTVGGSVFLVIVATVGLTAQFLLVASFGTLILSLAGLSSVGYSLIAGGWLRDSRARLGLSISSENSAGS